MNVRRAWVLACIFIFAGSSMAEVGGNLVVNVDCQYFEANGYLTYAGTAAVPDAGTVWNKLIFQGPDITNALDSNGSSTSIDITAQIGNAVSNNTNSGNDLLDDWWFDNTNTERAILISGLLPNTDYTLYMYGNETQISSEGCRFTFNAVMQQTVGAQAVPIPPNPWVLGYDHVIFNLTSDAGGQIVGTYGGDGNYNRWNGMQLIANFPDRLVIVESGSSSDVAESEPPTSDTFTVALASQPTHNVTVTLNPDSQLTVDDPVSGELLFTPINYNQAQPVTVTAVDDNAVEGPHIGKVTFALASDDPDYNNVPTPTLFVNVTDDDGGPLVQGLPVNVEEALATDPSGFDTYTIRLSSQPTEFVNVVITTDGQTTVDIDPNTPANENTLTFDPNDWNTPKNVYVWAVDDAFSEGPHISTITNTLSSLDLVFDGPISVVLANVADNEPYCGDGVSHNYYAADVNQDCYVNVLDFSAVSQDWLKCSDPDLAVSGCTLYP